MTRSLPKVYLIERDDGLIKVGQSANPESRLTGVRNKHKRNARLIAVRDVTPHLPEYAEGEIIHRLADFHVFGEWFRVSPERALAVLAEVLALPAGACRIKAQTAVRLRGGRTGYPKLAVRLDPDCYEIIIRLAALSGREPWYILKPLMEAVAWRALPMLNDPDFASQFTAHHLTKEEREKLGLPLTNRRADNVRAKAFHRHASDITPSDIADEVVPKIADLLE